MKRDLFTEKAIRVISERKKAESESVYDWGIHVNHTAGDDDDKKAYWLDKMIPLGIGAGAFLLLKWCRDKK